MNTEKEEIIELFMSIPQEKRQEFINDCRIFLEDMHSKHEAHLREQN